jgi:hypothetical protein
VRQPGILNNGETIRYALGLNVRNYRGLRRLDHGGFQAGYRTMVVYYPDIEGGIIVLGNTPGFRETVLADQITDIFFRSSLEPKETSPKPAGGTSSTAPLKSGPAPPLSSPWNPSAAELTQFAGQYFSSELETAYSVAFDNGKIVVRHRRIDDVPLVPVEKDIFKSKNWMFARVEFERDDRGDVTRMRVTPSNERVRRLPFDSVRASRSP